MRDVIEDPKTRPEVRDRLAKINAKLYAYKKESDELLDQPRENPV
jgi:hypothetical protein